MAQVLDSCRDLPDGTKIIRWHLLTDEYELIKPVERFLRFKSHKSRGTLKTYTYNLKIFWNFLEHKGIDWRDFNVDDMVNFGYWCLTEKFYGKNSIPIDSDRIKKIRSETTVNLILTVVTEFYNYHQNNTDDIEDKHFKIPGKNRPIEKGGLLAHYFKENPQVEKIIKYKEKDKFPGCLTSEQVGAIIKACNTARDKLIIWLMVDTGMRIGEVLGLHHKDIDWNKKLIHIVRRDNPNEAYAKGRQREISIAKLMGDPEFCDVLSQYFDEECPLDKVEKLGHGMVFVVLQRCSTYGQPLKAQNTNKLVSKIHKKTGIALDRVYPHLFRHTFVTHNIREGRARGKSTEDIAKTVQLQIGHRSIRTTLDVYDHSFNEADLREEIKRVTGKKEL